MTDNSLIIIFIISLICLSLSLMIIKGKKEQYSVIKSAVFGTVGYFFIYLFVSAGLLWFDVFSVKKCALVTLGICILGLTVVSIKNKLSALRKISFDKKEFIFFVLIILVSVLLTGSKFGFYGMGQDQGVYQTKAIEYIYDNNSNEYDFDYVADVLTDPKDYEYFRKVIISLQGYYFTGQTSAEYSTENTGGESGLRGIYHGIPTWPAMLALFGKMFGMDHMQDCQTVFYICFLMITIYIFENFKIKLLCEATSVAILATTPQIIWNSKSALTEMFLAVIMATFIYLVCNENKDVRWLSCIPVAAFSFYHASVYVMLPLFVLVGWIIYIGDRRIRNIISVLVMLMTYLAGFFFMHRLSYFYSVYNYYNPIIRLNRTIGEHYVFAVLLAVIIAAVLSIILPFVLKISFIKKLGKISPNKKGTIIKIVSGIIFLFTLYQYVKINHSLTVSPMMNLVALSFATGIISILLAIIGLFAIAPHKIEGTPIMVILTVFLYLIVWSVFFKPYVDHYYYVGRYIVPYFIVIMVFLNVIYKEIKKFDWIPFVCAASVIMYLDYDFEMIRTPDDTKVEWNVIKEELEKDKLPNSAYIIDYNHETMLEWMLSLKASGEDVYPYDGDLDAQAEKLSKYYDNLYFMHEGRGKLYIDEYTKLPFELECRYTFKHSEDYENKIDSWIGYPNSFFSEEKKLEVFSLSN